MLRLQFNNRVALSSCNRRALLYRIPNQPSLDQNTVDQQVELAKYTENEIHFEAAFTRLNGSFKGLIKALRGE
ncbi:MAG: hypothetical protein ACTIAS_23500, partial [Pseudomonas helleri]